MELVSVKTLRGLGGIAPNADLLLSTEGILGLTEQEDGRAALILNTKTGPAVLTIEGTVSELIEKTGATVRGEIPVSLTKETTTTSLGAN